jgi:hypothetical protein
MYTSFLVMQVFKGSQCIRRLFHAHGNFPDYDMIYWQLAAQGSQSIRKDVKRALEGPDGVVENRDSRRVRQCLCMLSVSIKITA